MFHQNMQDIHFLKARVGKPPPDFHISLHLQRMKLFRRWSLFAYLVFTLFHVVLCTLGGVQIIVTRLPSTTTLVGSLIATCLGLGGEQSIICEPQKGR